MGNLGYADVKKQSLSVFGQFGHKRWIPFSKQNVKLEHRNAKELYRAGLGKVLVIAAMGESLEGAIPLLQKYRDRFDLMTCDKGFSPLLEHGLKSDYVMICDTNIPAHYLEKHVLETKDVKLIATTYANLSWTGSWMGPRYFYINRDAIESEKYFYPIFGNDCHAIPASSNVSNAMITFMAGCDERNRVNWAGYDRYILVGYDYSWQAKGKYYAWYNPLPKRNYMNHRTALDINNDIVHTSENLLFSARWLTQYLKSFPHLPVVNCSGRGILQTQFDADLEQQLKTINPDPRAREMVRSAFEAAMKSQDLYQETKNAFTKVREVLTWPQETMPKSQHAVT